MANRYMKRYSTLLIIRESKSKPQWDTSHLLEWLASKREEIKMLATEEKGTLVHCWWECRPCIKKQRHGFASKALYSQSYGFSSSYVQMWELDHKEGRTPKNWCFQPTVLEKTLDTPFDSKDIKAVNPKGNKSWIFIARTDPKTEAPIHWTPPIQSADHWKRTWCWERLRTGGEGGNKGWDGWMASSPQWKWAWANSRTLWRTRKPGVLQSLGLQSQTQLSHWMTTVCTATI